MVTLMEAIEEYDGDLALRRVARSTRVKYRQHLHAFAEAVGKKRNPASVSTHEIKMHLAVGRGTMRQTSVGNSAPQQ
jgi:hypothetical protein